MNLILMNNSKFLFSMSPLQSKDIMSNISKITANTSTLYTLIDDKFFRDKFQCINILSPNMVKYVVQNDTKLANYFLNSISFREQNYYLDIPFDISDNDFKRLLDKAIDEDKLNGLKLLMKLIDGLIFVELGSGGWIKLTDIKEYGFQGHLTVINQTGVKEYINDLRIH